MDLISVLTIIGIAIANIGTTISLFLWSTNHTEKARDQTTAILKSIAEEMKDFHGRLERQDAEFKAHLLYEHAKEKGK